MTPEAHEDFVDLVQCLRQAECEFVIVGAHALAAHGIARATADFDVFVRPDRTNAERVFRALARFGAPLAAHAVDVADFATPGSVYQMGLPPRRIDILTSISGVSYDEAVRDRVEGQLGSERIPCIGRDALLKNKRASGRPKDLVDVDLLEAAALAR